MKYKFWLILFSLVILLSLLTWSSASLSDLEQITSYISFNQNQVFNYFEEKVVTQDRIFEIKETLLNPDFEEDFQHWDRVGLVNLLTAWQEINPWSGQKMIQLGDELNSGQLLDNCLEQTINQTQLLKNLGFRYQVITSEDLAGFDQPLFVVFVNDQPVFKKSANSEQQSNINWQLGLIDLSRFDEQTLELKFCAGNSGDSLGSSFVLLDQVTTDLTVLNAHDQLLLSSVQIDHYLQAGYEVNSIHMSKTSDLNSDLSLSFSSTLDDHQIEIQVFNQNQTLVKLLLLPVLIDVFPPENVTDLAVFNELDHQISLSLTVPADKGLGLSHYQLAVSNQDDLKQNWLNLPKLKLLELSPDFYSIPDLTGIKQTLIARFNPADLDLTTNYAYYFALKSFDLAGNSSAISNVVKLDLISNPTPTPPISPTSATIKINEIMFNPDGNDSGQALSGEWVELLNLSQTAIDVNQWQLVDQANNTWLITAENSDTNNILSDSGETVIESGERLITLKSGSPILNNSGDSLSLIDGQAELRDEVSYNSATDEGLTVGRLPDGSSTWVNDLTPTPLNVNAK